MSTLPGMTHDEKLRFENFSENLLAWYSKAARELPWRLGPKARASGAKAEPYRVWLAEIMLQQTTVAHAIPYFVKFTDRWPDVAALAAADDADVMAAWAGLGYYARARNLLKCARVISARSGVWPQTAHDLQTLPGIGPYTAGAVAALAFGQPRAAVDANVERVFARLLTLSGPWSAQKSTIRTQVQALVPQDRPAEFAEALMDLGATICTPKAPQCEQCPVHPACLAYPANSPERYPMKPPKPAKPIRHGHVFVAHDPECGVWTETRPARGLLGGMLGLPTSEWEIGEPRPPSYPFVSDWRACGEVRHVFTHFALYLQVWRTDELPQAGETTDLARTVEALPTVFRKALKQAQKDVDKF